MHWGARLFATTAIAVALSAAAFSTHAHADAAACNDAIAKLTQRVLSTQETSLKACIRHGPGYCPGGGEAIDAARNQLLVSIGNPDGVCGEAVSGGTPLDDFGPGVLCTQIVAAGYDAYCGIDSGQVQDVEDLAGCLVCSTDGIIQQLGQRIAAFQAFNDKNEAKCLSKMFEGALKAIRAGRNDVAKCALHGTQPFSCPVTDAPESKLGKALVKLQKRAAKCTDAAGVPGVVAPSVLEQLCPERASANTTELAQCYGAVAKCQACQFSNLAFGQSQDCTAFSGVGCHTTRAYPGMQYVVNQGDDTVTYYKTDGTLLNGTVAASSFTVGDVPTDVAVNREDNVVYVTNSVDGTVTYLDGRTGAPYLGSLAASTIATGANPIAAAFAPAQSSHRRALFVLNQGDETVTILHPRSGQPLNGSLASSTFPVGSNPTALAVVSGFDVWVAVTNFDDDSVTRFSPIDRDYANGTFAASTSAVGDGPIAFGANGVINSLDDTLSRVSWDAGTTIVTDALLPGTRLLAENEVGIPPIGYFADNPSTWALTDTGDVVFLETVYGPLDHAEAGTVAQSTFDLGNGAIDLATYQPSSVFTEADGLNARYYVLLQGDEELASFRPDISGDSRLFLSCGVHGFQVDATTELAYALCANGNVVVIDATEPAFAFGTEAASTFPLPKFAIASGLALDPVSGTLYAGSFDYDGDVFGLTFADAGTLTPLAGSPFSFGPIGGVPALPPYADPVRAAVNAGAGIVYQTDRLAQGIVYLDNATAAFVGGSKAAATLTLGTQPLGVASSEASALAYVADYEDDTLTYVQAGSVAYAGADFASSTLAVGQSPSDVAVNDTAGLVYVANQGDSSVTYLDSATTAYAMGSLAASTVAVEPLTRVAVDPTADILYTAGTRLVLLDATTGAYLNGTLEDSDYPTPTPGTQFVAVNPTSQVLLVANGATISYHDAATGLYVDWGPKVTKQPTGPNPVAIGVMR